MKYIWPLLAIITTTVHAQTFTLSEKSLIELSKKQNPTLDEIQATFLNSKAAAMELEDKFGYDLYAGYNKIETKEKATIPFQPIFKNVNQYKVGVKKYSKYGLVLDANAAVDQRSGASASGSDYKNIHTTIYEVGLQMDLWKDLWGKITRKQFDNIQHLKKKDELQAQISTNVFQNNIRRIYWSLVANAEKIRIYKNLYATSERQLKDAKRRKANSVSDTAEVARFESLVHQRKGQVLLQEYERENLFKTLREMFPELNSKNLLLSKYNIDKTVYEVLTCSMKIGQAKEIPFEYTLYDDVIDYLREIQTNQNKVDQSYDDIDLKLDLKLAQIGVSSNTNDSTNYYGDYNDSINDLRNNDRSSVKAGLLLTIPFGESRKDTTAVKEKITESQFKANIDKLSAQTKATHTQVQESVKLLSQLIQAQKENSKSLAVRVKEMKKKYNQARIPEYALIQDEDSLLQSDINVVNTQLQVVNTILDYFSVFNTYPCSFNRTIQ